MNLRQEIVAEMKRQDMTQRQLSKLTKIPESRLSEWFNGKYERGASERTINVVMKALGLKVTPTKKADPSPPSKPKS